MGSRLAFLADADGSLPGFMGTGAALRDSSGKFRGMILERLSGRCVDRVVCTPGFADVRYIHDMLKSTFIALQRAQSWLGESAAQCLLAIEVAWKLGACVLVAGETACSDPLQLLQQSAQFLHPVACAHHDRHGGHASSCTAHAFLA